MSPSTPDARCTVRAALRQPERDPLSALEQLTVLIVAMEGLFDGLAEQQVVAALAVVRSAAQVQLQPIAERIVANQPLRAEDRALIVRTAASALSALSAADQLSAEAKENEANEANEVGEAGR